MGLPMAQNLIKAGHQVEGVDVSAAAIEKLESAGGGGRGEREGAARRVPTSSSPCCRPGKQVREIYLGADGIVENAQARHAADRFLDHRCRDARARLRRRPKQKAC